MNIYFTLEKPIKENKNSIFLAGPTYRQNDVISPYHLKSWRYDAINILSKLNFDGDIYIPEWKNNIKPEEWTYSRQIDWENEYLNKAKVILFWIPREMKLLPGLTTNIEFGEWMKSNKIVVGWPYNAEKIKYIKEKCIKYNIPWTTISLEDCVLNAIKKLNDINSIENKYSTWFTADTHFGHIRTLELSKRPFISLLDMDCGMVYNWNKVIHDNDIVYHLGDFGNPLWLQQLKAKKIYFLPGNYDTPEIISELLKDSRVTIIPNNTLIKINDYDFNLIHEPEKFNNENNFNLFGHIHKLQMVKRNGLNVGVDCHNFAPINEETILFYYNAIMNHYDKNVFMNFKNEV
jgi:calcineurin-like phosphoesterase family protein